MRQQATLARLTTSGDKAAAVALAHLGREAETKEAVTQLLELEPNFRIAEWVARTGSSKLQIYIDGLRKAGLPE